MTIVFQYMKMMMQLVVDKNKSLLYSLNILEEDDDIVHFDNNIAAYDVGMYYDQRKISMGISRKPGFLKSFIISESKFDVIGHIKTSPSLEPDNDYVKYFLTSGPLVLKSSKGILHIISFDDELRWLTTNASIDISENATLVEVKNTKLHNASLTLLKFISEKFSESISETLDGNHDQKSTFWLALDNDKIYNYITLVSNDNSSEHICSDYVHQNSFSEIEWKQTLDGKDRKRNINIPNVCAQVPHLNSYGERCTCFAYLEQLVDYGDSDSLPNESKEVVNIILFWGESNGCIHRQQYGKPLLSRRLCSGNAEIFSEPLVTAKEFPVKAIEVVQRGGGRSPLLVVSIATNVFIIDSNHFELYAEYVNVGVMKLIINDLKPQLYMIPLSEEPSMSSSIFSESMSEERVRNAAAAAAEGAIPTRRENENTGVCQNTQVTESESPTSKYTTTTTSIELQLERKEVIVNSVIVDLPWEGNASGYNRIYVMGEGPRDILGLVDLESVFHHPNRKRKEEIESTGAIKKKGKKKKKAKVNDLRAQDQEAKGLLPLEARNRPTDPSVRSWSDAGQLRSSAFTSLLSVLQARHRKALASGHLLRQSLSSRYCTLWALRRLLLEELAAAGGGAGTVTAGGVSMLPSLLEVACNMIPAMTQTDTASMDKDLSQADSSCRRSLLPPPPAASVPSQAAIPTLSPFGISGEGVNILRCSYTLHPSDTSATTALYSPRLLMVFAEVRNDTRVTVYDVMLSAAHISPPPLPSPLSLSADSATVPSLSPTRSATLTMALSLPVSLFYAPYTMTGAASHQHDYSSTTSGASSGVLTVAISVGLNWLMKCHTMKDEKCSYDNLPNSNYRHTSRFLDERVSLSISPLIDCSDITSSYRRFGKGGAILKIHLPDTPVSRSSSSSSRSYDNRQSESDMFVSVDRWRTFPFYLAHKNTINPIHPFPQNRKGSHPHPLHPYHHLCESSIPLPLQVEKTLPPYDTNRSVFARSLTFRLISRHHVRKNRDSTVDTDIDTHQIQSMTDKMKHILSSFPHPLLKVINYNSTTEMDSETFPREHRSKVSAGVVDQMTAFDDSPFISKPKLEKLRKERKCVDDCFPSGTENALLILERSDNRCVRDSNSNSYTTSHDPYRCQYVDGRLSGLNGAALTMNLTPLVAHLERNEISFRVTLEDHEVATLLESAAIMRSEFNCLASQWKRGLIRRRGGIPRPRPLMPPSGDAGIDRDDREEGLIALGPRLSCTTSDAVDMLLAQRKTDFSVAHAMFIVRIKRDVLNMFAVYSQC